ncbi:pilus assembly protein [Halioxenophilus sp. WMMB6]|uniref:pilus assembly protein n=1 Tax=Halioxenophilus sp. WMMB6 TaxID=3073815 RepID=UPI00295ECD22|nr:PilC/PilY family type IV pilus protein [Halioxenophilus sp. WMMB6]
MKFVQTTRNLAMSCLVAVVAISICHSAWSLTLPKKPLLIEASIEPNVMLLLDDSGSMIYDWYFGDYDKDTDYADCPATITIAGYSATGGTYYQVVAHTNSSGYAYFSYRGSNYAWGTTDAIDSNTGLQQACFDDSDDYYVQYSDDFTNLDGDNDDIYDGKDSWKGNFWNYYFSNSDQTDGDNWGEEDQKFGVGERVEIAQDAAKLLLRNLDGIRIGLAGFNGGSGGTILVGIDSIDDVVDASTGETQEERMITQVNGIYANGSTPLGESLHELGRYYIEGHTDETLTLHPGGITGTETTAAASSVFNQAPTYLNGTTVPTSAQPVIQAYCQKNFVVMLTDGAPTSDSNLNSYLSGYDADGVTGSNGIMDDVALALYDIDLRPDLNEFDGSAIVNNISTYLIAGFGLGSSTIMTNTVNNGVGVGITPDASGTLYQADDADALISAFDDIFEEIFASAGSLTSISFNSGSLQVGSALYQATFTRSDSLWNGDLKAYAYDSANGMFATTASWSAETKLSTRVALSGHSDRLILTMSNTGDGIPFTEANWASLSTEQQNDLKGGGSETDGKAVLNYLRGASNALYRDRTTTTGSMGLLGDIVNSSPVEVGEPEVGYPDYGALLDNGTTVTLFGSASDPYSSFVSSNSSRASMVYVGSNDGMVHAFYGDLSTGGGEAFAYIPSMVFDSSSNEEGLYYLTDPDYQHRFYVDGPITASDVYLDPNGGVSKSWRTVIVGGLRAGGRGLYALDVTNPAQFTAGNASNIVLWEFDENDDSDIGHVYGEVRIAMMANGKWAAILGNGYNSGSGEAKLFIVYLEQGVDGSWSSGDWVELSTGIGSDNGMGAPVLADLNGDYIPDRIYAGDLKGNLWAFDVSDTSDANWHSAYLDGTTPKPLFTAKDSSGNVQPITTQPLITLNPSTTKAGNGENVLVFFGTGKFIELSDYTDNSAQTFYAVWDRGDDQLLRGNLTARTLAAATLTDVNGDTVSTRTVSGSTISWWNGTTGSYGWYMDLPETGERNIVEPYVLQGTLFFATSVPSTASCSNGGKGWVNSVGTDGLSSTTPIYDADGDGDVDEDDLGYVGERVEDGLPSGAAYIGGGDGSVATDPCPKKNGQYQAFSTSSGEVQYRWVCPADAAAVGRMSWQEMLRQ